MVTSTTAKTELKQLGGILRDFTKSPEGVKEFEKLGLQYNNNLQDDLYEQWLSETSAENLSDFTSKKEKEITCIRVVQVSKHEYDDEGKEQFEYFVEYDDSHTRIDRAGNPVSRYLPNQGMYPIPRPHYKLGEVKFGKMEREIDYIASTDTGYTIPWTKANLLKLIKEIPLRKENGGPGVGAKTAGGISFSVKRFENLLNAKSFEELTGKGVNDEMIARLIRQRSDQLTGAIEKPITASDVERMLDEKSKQQVQTQTQQTKEQS